MQIFEEIKKTREYMIYIEEHCLNVNRAWSEIVEKCKDMRFVYDDYVYFSINDEVERHDLSKMSEHEFIQYRKAFYPTAAEAIDGKYDMTAAWEHHKANNPHHWENWTTIPDGDPYAKEIHCVHMIIDWTAMGYKFGDTAQAYYEKNKDKIDLPEWAVKFIYEIFARLSAETTDPGRPVIPHRSGGAVRPPSFPKCEHGKVIGSGCNECGIGRQCG